MGGRAVIEVGYFAIEPVSWAILSIDDLDGQVNVHLKSPAPIDAHLLALSDYELHCGDGQCYFAIGANVGADFSRFHLDLLFEVPFDQLVNSAVKLRIVG